MESLKIFKNILHSKHSRRTTHIGLGNSFRVITNKLTDLTWPKITLIMETDLKPFGMKDLTENTKDFHFTSLERLNKRLLLILKCSMKWLNSRSKMSLLNFLKSHLKTASWTKRTLKTFKVLKTLESKLLIILILLSYLLTETFKAVISQMVNKRKYQSIHLTKRFRLFFSENVQSKTFRIKIFFWHLKLPKKAIKTL